MQDDEEVGPIQKFIITINGSGVERYVTFCHCDGKPLDLKEGDVITLGEELKCGK